MTTANGKPFSTVIRTANYFYNGVDRLDITVKYAEEHPDYLGACLAPTWDMVGGIKHWFYAAEVQQLVWANRKDSKEYREAFERLLKWQSNPLITPTQYAEQYLTLLRFRYARNPQPFIAIASLESVTMVCYCAGKMQQHCHRALAIEPISKVAQRMGRTPIILGEQP
jgi:hypothetical protein